MNKFKVIRERPGYYNDGDGSVQVICEADESKNVKITQNNCFLNEKQIVKLYDYLQKNSNIKSTYVHKNGSGYEGPDADFSVSFSDKNGHKASVSLAELPNAENPELMAAMGVEIGEQKTADKPQKKFVVLEASGYQTDGDHILLIRDTENGEITKDVRINKGHQFSSCQLTIDQIMKIYGCLEANQENRTFVEKKTQEDSHYTSDENLVIYCNHKKLALSELPSYENALLRNSLEAKFGDLEKTFKAEDTELKNKSTLSKLRDRVSKNGKSKFAKIGMMASMLLSAIKDNSKE
ncbi:MAG: hypothetical protein IKN71_05785 [Alphaproteobacteria bacterium]|nr:hypothetical protein [Alphaproteobacteria bacterium]